MVKKTAPTGTLIDLGSAIGEIRQACDELGGDAHRSPFFVIAGAGISHPPVPLASNIIEHCKHVAGRYKRDSTVAAAAVLDNYSAWFERAYPGARQRQQYMRSLIEKKPLSIASLRLAHLLSAGRLTNVVITTNFDDFLPRALRLFGQEPAVCDHPRTIGRIDSDLRDIQIVHVHGSYLFYDLANLRGEVTARARPDRETSLTMMGLLDSLLWARSPLVVGYSGWEGDLIMAALRRRLRGGNPLAQSIYWFCYRRSDFESLPPWLRSSPDVRFVVPPPPPPPPAPAAAGGERAGPTSEPPPEPTMPAYEVFDRLNESFEVGEPAIFQNPVRYLAQTLQSSLPEVSGTTSDPYSFKALIERLNKAASTFDATTAPALGLEADLHRLRGLMRESNYAQAVPLLAAMIPGRLSELDDAARKEVLGAARLAGATLLSKKDRGPLGDELARVAVFDPVTHRLLGDVPAGTVWCIGSRADEFGYEMLRDDKPNGAFTYTFAGQLAEARADLDHDGRISLLECVIATARELGARQDTPQIPVVAGDADRVALFAARPGVKRPYATLRALLVGVSGYKESPHALRGTANDVARLGSVLRRTKRRLFGKVRVEVLEDRAATRAGVTKALRAMARLAAPDDILMMYFSGHGIKTRAESPSPQADAEGISIVLHDFSETGKSGALTNRELAALWADSKAPHKLLVLDF